MLTVNGVVFENIDEIEAWSELRIDRGEADYTAGRAVLDIAEEVEVWVEERARYGVPARALAVRSVSGSQTPPGTMWIRRKVVRITRRPGGLLYRLFRGGYIVHSVVYDAETKTAYADVVKGRYIPLKEITRLELELKALGPATNIRVKGALILPPGNFLLLVKRRGSALLIDYTPS